MGYWISGGIGGLIAIIIFSAIFTPFLCNSIRVENPQVSCSLNENTQIFMRIYGQASAFPLLIFGYLTGAFMLKLLYAVKNTREKGFDLTGKTPSREYKWTWEYK